MFLLTWCGPLIKAPAQWTSKVYESHLSAFSQYNGELYHGSLSVTLGLISDLRSLFDQLPIVLPRLCMTQILYIYINPIGLSHTQPSL